MCESNEKAERPWRWGVWGAADDDWHAELERRQAEQLGPTEDQANNDTTDEAPAVVRAAVTTEIPRILHQIWLGPTELPHRCVAWMQSLRQHHPTWEYRLWRDEDVKGFRLRNEKAFAEATNYGEKSDILRYEILERVGGVYVDVDVECLQPLDEILSRFSFVVGISNTRCVEINNAVIAACPGHPILNRMVDKIYKTTHQPQLNTAALALIAQLGGGEVAQHMSLDGAPASATPMGTIERTGPGLLTRTFMDAIGWATKSSSERCRGFLPQDERDRVVALPTEYLYPLANDTHEDARTAFPPHALAVHYWLRSWMSPSTCIAGH